ncbi:MAG: hypothetical protein WBX17_06340 [Microbacterium sp.]
MLVGCAIAAPVRSPLPPAAAAAIVDCDADTEEVKPGRIPNDFVPTIAYRCDEILTLATPDAEPPPPPPSPPHAYAGDLSSLVSALTQPDDPKWDGPCAAMMKLAADIWLEDASGTIIRVAHPVDGCGQPKAEAVYDALEKLSIAP